MKKLLDLAQLMPSLSESTRDSIFHMAKAEGRNADDLTVRRLPCSEKAAKPEDKDAPPRSAVKYVSARTLDRDNEIIVPKGIDLSEFSKYMHVLWNHNYSLPPIGSDAWLKADDYGLKAQTVYADTGEGTLADIIWKLVEAGHQKASSIGFVPLAWTQQGHNDFERVATQLSKVWPEFAKVKDITKRIYTKVMLLEHSDVSVPANPDAEIIDIAKGFGADDDLLTTLGLPVVKTMKDQAPDTKSELPPPPPKADPVIQLYTPTVKVLRAASDAPDLAPLDIGAILSESVKTALDRMKGKV
jgi:phage head maturation protease